MKVLCVAAAAVLAIVGVTLQGCGGSTTTTKPPAVTTTTKPAPPTPPSPPATTTTKPPSPTPGKTSTTTAHVTTTVTTTMCVNTTDPLALQLNTLYYSETSGATIRWVETVHAKDGKWFYCEQGCEPGGYCDCRVSASLFNSKMMIRTEGNAALIHDAFGSPLGVVFDQELVEQTLAKCYYPYDAGAGDRYNRGCGCPMPKKNWNCTNPQSAYQNIDPKTNKSMTSTSADVADCHCGTGKRDQGEPKNKSGAQCYWKGPAFYPKIAENELQQMIKSRIDDQKAPGAGKDETQYWNEVVMDGLLVKQHLSKAVKAVVWMKHSMDEPDAAAYKSAQDFSEWFGKQIGTAPPIVSIDASVDINKCGPFKAEKASLEWTVV